MPHQVTPFLMFDGVAENAMNFFPSLSYDWEILEIERHGPGEPPGEGAVKRAILSLSGQKLICIDSPVDHDFPFTPSFSIFVDCESESEVQRVFNGLSDEEEILMPLDNYGISSIFGWVNNRFGVSW
jgi:predicted 3-demethylubiquinone-9 3-methyltransferase (glyoxalase superfamily)